MKKEKTGIKKNCELLIDYLSDKTLSNGCVVKDKEGYSYQIGDAELIDNDRIIDSGCGCCSGIDDKISEFKVIGHPVLIGHVLQKMMVLNFCEINGTNPMKERLVSYWGRCGFTKSLNDIFEEIIIQNPNKPAEGATAPIPKEFFLDENIQQLYEFLMKLFGEKLKTKR